MLMLRIEADRGYAGGYSAQEIGRGFKCSVNYLYALGYKFNINHRTLYQYVCVEKKEREWIKQKP